MTEIMPVPRNLKFTVLPAGSLTDQRVVIHYKCIGAFDVPDRRKIPEADIIMETRKGVALSYAPERRAV